MASFPEFSHIDDDVMKWKHYPCYWPFVWRIHRSPVNYPKGQWRGALVFCLICACTNGWVNNRDAGDLRRKGHKCLLWRHCNVASMHCVYAVHCRRRHVVGWKTNIRNICYFRLKLLFCIYICFMPFGILKICTLHRVTYAINVIYGPGWSSLLENIEGRSLAKTHVKLCKRALGVHAKATNAAGMGE